MGCFEDIKTYHEGFKKDIKRYSTELLYNDLPLLTEEKFLLYEKTGNRLIYEKIYFERRKFLNVFFFAVFLYKEEIYIKKLEEIIYSICEEMTWALPAHVDLSKEDWKYTVDLFSSETAQALSCIYYYLKDILSEKCLLTIEENVEKRVLNPYIESEYGYHRWENWNNNWISVCASSIGSASLYLPDKGNRDRILDRVEICLGQYLKGFGDDGVCLEGLGYFTYGMEYFIGFANQLYEYSDGSKDLLDNKKTESIVLFQQNCFLPGGNTISFSDGSTNDRFRPGLSCFLKNKFDEFEIPPMEFAMKFDTDHCYRFMANLEDYLWVKEFLEKNESENKSVEEKSYEFIFYKDAQWAVWKNKDIGLALKGGNNNEPHNHNDIGSFILSCDGEIFLTDLGCGEYTKEYFREDTRYKIFNNRSLSHNVPLINGEEQRAGKEYKCRSFKSPKSGQVVMSYAKAYGLDDISLKRKIEYYSEGDILIEDRLKKAGGSLRENLISPIKPKIEDNKIILTGKRAALCIEISEGDKDISLKEIYFKNHNGMDESVWQIQFAGVEDNNISSAKMQFIFGFF